MLSDYRLNTKAFFTIMFKDFLPNVQSIRSLVFNVFDILEGENLSCFILEPSNEIPTCCERLYLNSNAASF